MGIENKRSHDDGAEDFFLEDTNEDQPDAIAGSTQSRQCLRNSDDEVDDDIEGDLNEPTREKRRALCVAVGGAVTFLSLLAVVVHGPFVSSSSNMDDAASKYAVIDNAQPNWQIVTKERDRCSKKEDNCISTKCCAVAGHKCYMKSKEVAECMKSCEVGKDSPTCAIPQEQVGFEGEPGSTLFCFSVYTNNTGSTKKKSYEKELLTQQHAMDASIFACDAFAVYSDVRVSLGGEIETIKVEDKEHDFHFAKRQETGAWVNTGMFKQVWKAIGERGTYKKYDWTVKVDPDAVFLPRRLMQRIRTIPRPENGIFLVNCRDVDNGFFGNLEVFSAMAFSILVANVDRCNGELPWKTGVKGGEYGPMGEDLFAEKCLEKNGVGKAEAFDITIDGACPADRPRNFLHSKHWHVDCKDVSTASAMHPFKTTYEYFRCLKETQATVM